LFRGGASGQSRPVARHAVFALPLNVAGQAPDKTKVPAIL